MLSYVIKLARLKQDLWLANRRVYITHRTLSSSSLLSGFIKVFACFQNEIKVHRCLLGRRDGISCNWLPFGWRCHTKSSHTGWIDHGWTVKSFHPGRRSLLHTQSLTPPALSRHGYITFSKSCKDRMILSSWKQWEDIFSTDEHNSYLGMAQERLCGCYCSKACFCKLILDELKLSQ